MKSWLRALAWRLLGIRLIPVAPGDVLILTVPPITQTNAHSLNLVSIFCEAMHERGVKVNILVDDTRLTAVLHDRAHLRRA